MAIIAGKNNSTFNKLKEQANDSLQDCPESAIKELGTTVLDDIIFELNFRIESQIREYLDNDTLLHWFAHKKFGAILGFELDNHTSWTESLVSELNINIDNDTRDYLLKLEEISARKIIQANSSPLNVGFQSEAVLAQNSLGAALMRSILIDLYKVVFMVKICNEHQITSTILNAAFTDKSYILEMIFDRHICEYMQPLRCTLDKKSDAYMFISRQQHRSIDEAVESLS